MGPPIDEIQREIHGTEVDERGVCDYCEQDLDSSTPVEHAVMKVVDLPKLRQHLDIPAGWVVDIAMCESCELDEFTVETDGVAEALVMVSREESATGFPAIDSSQIQIVDYSPGHEGVYPPAVTVDLMRQYRDLGITRWERIRRSFAHGQLSGLGLGLQVRLSKEVPSSVEDAAYTSGPQSQLYKQGREGVQVIKCECGGDCVEAPADEHSTLESRISCQDCQSSAYLEGSGGRLDLVGDPESEQDNITMSLGQPPFGQ